jgi:small nuclear ribonucleoprotein (snRNP)-like protein
MLIDLKDKKTNVHRIHEEELFQLGHFRTIQDLANVAVGTTVEGTWPITLLSGEKFTAIGTLKSYDSLLKILIRRTTSRKRKPKDKNDIILK